MQEGNEAGILSGIMMAAFSLSFIYILKRAKEPILIPIILCLL